MVLTVNADTTSLNNISPDVELVKFKVGTTLLPDKVMPLTAVAFNVGVLINPLPSVVIALPDVILIVPVSAKTVPAIIILPFAPLLVTVTSLPCVCDMPVIVNGVLMLLITVEPPLILLVLTL